MTFAIQTDIQWAAVGEPVCDARAFNHWAGAAVLAGLGAAPRTLPEFGNPRMLTIRIVDAAESSALNQGFRSKPGATNVLAFPAEDALFSMVSDEEPELGDLVICLPVVTLEAAEQGKSVIAHLAHMVVHGTLHLLGFYHISESDAEVMEALEVTVLATLGYSNPYQLNKD